MMIEILKYIFWGCIHFGIVVFEFFDFIEQVIIGLLILFFIAIAIWDRKFIKIYLDIGKTFFKMLFSSFGIILFITVISYYMFSIFAFEENINILVIIITLALFFKDLFELMENSILNENKKTITSILEICKSVFILFFYRLLYAIEFRNFEELNKVFCSLIFVPIIAIIIIFMKILTTVETITVRYSNKEKLKDIEYLKLFLIILLKEKSINNTYKVINNFFINNRQITYDEARNKIMNFKKINNSKMIDNIQSKK